MKVTVMQYKRKIQDLKNDALTQNRGGEPGPVSGILLIEKDKVQTIAVNSLDCPLISINNSRNTAGISVSNTEDTSISPHLMDSGKTKFPLI